MEYVEKNFEYTEEEQKKRIFQKGEIYIVYRRYYDSHAVGKPMLVISSSLINDNTNYVYFAQLTEEEVRTLPTHMKIKTKRVRGYIICESQLKVERDSIGPCIGSLEEKEISELDKRLSLVFEVGINLKQHEEFVKYYEKVAKKSERKEAEQTKRLIEKYTKEALCQNNDQSNVAADKQDTIETYEKEKTAYINENKRLQLELEEARKTVKNLQGQIEQVNSTASKNEISNVGSDSDFIALERDMYKQKCAELLKLLKGTNTDDKNNK